MKFEMTVLKTVLKIFNKHFYNIDNIENSLLVSINVSIEKD